MLKQVLIHFESLIKQSYFGSILFFGNFALSMREMTGQQIGWGITKIPHPMEDPITETGSKCTRLRQFDAS